MPQKPLVPTRTHRDYPCIVSPRSSIATNSLIFRFLVSAFLTAPIRYRIVYRFLLLSVLKKAAAVGFSFSAHLALCSGTTQACVDALGQPDALLFGLQTLLI